MSAAKHAFVPTSCDTCHEANLNFYLGASSPALQGRPADHLASSNAQMVGGDSGRSCMRMPMAWLTALATAANGGTIGTSPTPTPRDRASARSCERGASAS